ncbi:MAG TPA: OadG family protein [Mobilitalea sp.]|nr:OadG family protein [Mobilitalea sp.]
MHMPLSEAILDALFCMAFVFAVLAMLWGIIRIFSASIRAIESRKNKSTDNINR